jgi:hypothetical protein
MKLTFYWPNNNAVQDNEFIIGDYSYTQCYYNELRPADNYVNVSIPWNTDTANKLRLLKDDNIKAVITDDGGAPVFTGYIDDGTDFTKTQTLQPIGFKLINQSFLLRRTVGETFAIKNKTVSQILTQLLTRLNIAYSGTEVANIVPILVVNEDDEYYDVIDTLLFEYGHTFDFNNAGIFVVLPVFNQPPASVSDIFDGGNIRSAVRQTVNKRQYDYIKVKFSEVRVNTNDLLYNDTDEKSVPARCYFGHEEETGQGQIVDIGAVHAEYASSKGDLIWADVDPDNLTFRTSPASAFVIEKTGTFTSDVSTTLGNKGTSYAFRARNNTNGVAKIKEIKAIGTSYTRNAAFEVSKTGSLLNEYESKYLQRKNDASSFAKNLANYYRYSSIKLSLDSYTDYKYGSFVKVTETGIGEIKARIVRKTYKLNNPISYELESVTDFEPADITQESTWGNNSTNDAGRGPDITPPTAPSNLTLSLRDDGRVVGSFTASTDEGSDVNYYSVFRKTPDMPYKSVITLSAEITNFVDESAINGMSYTYKVHAADNHGNVSNPSNEASIGTVTIGRPYAPAFAEANAFNDYITVSVTPPTLAQDNRDIYTPAEYKIQISKNGGTTYTDTVITANTSYDYYFDRQADGYPEKNALDNYRFRIYSVNIFGNISANAVICTVGTSDYITWTPSTPSGFSGESTGRTLYLNWNRQSIYGTLVYRIQISKDGVNWYKPSALDPYESEDNWKEGGINGFLEVSINSFYQTVPLKGQNNDLGSNRYVIEPVAYYYRICAANNDTGYATAWTGSVKLTAEGTSAQDILKNSIGWDQIIDQSIKVSKLGVDKLIAGESTLAFVANDTDVSNKDRAGFQFWALDNITIDGVKYNKGEFKINADNGDYFRIEPGQNGGISFKASKIVMDSLGTNVYGDFKVYRTKSDPASNPVIFVDAVDNNGNALSNPTIWIGASYTGFNTVTRVEGTMYVPTPDLPAEESFYG